jgi:light-regulated signal transduction histidine kinase (bacteriophytochrome)
MLVRDNGIGFDMQYHDRIFAMFQRLHRADAYPGTGIGLAIARKAVERAGGKIWAESSPGSGATFYIELPAAQ